MVDLHCHLLPGIDDGPRTMAGSVALARAQLAAGVRTVAATPHVTRTFPNDSALISRGVESLRQALDAAGAPLEVVGGAEVDLRWGLELADEELEALRLGGGPWLLLEAPLQLYPRVPEGVRELLVRGHRILLAHPERSPSFQRDPESLRHLVDAGVRTQLTATAFAGAFGRTVQRFAEWLLDEGLVHIIASDAHDAERRAPGLRAPLEAAGLGDCVVALTDEAPAAVLAGDELPAAAAPSPRPGRRRPALRRVLRARRFE